MIVMMPLGSLHGSMAYCFYKPANYYYICWFLIKVYIWFLYINVFLRLKILFRAYNFIIKSISRSLIIFKKPRKMINDFFSHNIFVRTFQWTSSECQINVTITVKIAMVTYIHCENC